MGDSADMNCAGPSRHRRRAIVLIGMRGSGKTCVGRVLAELMTHRPSSRLKPFGDTFAFGGSWTEPFADVDEMIAESAGRSITEIFARQGETSFRNLEHQAIRSICAAPPTVISVGGGAVLDEENVRALAKIGLFVWLTAPANVLWDRIQRDAQSAPNRPPLTEETGLDEIQTLLARRSDVYRRVADVEIETTGNTPEQIAADILAWYAASGHA